LPKAGDWACQDALKFNAERAAVADGVTNGSFMSRMFAQRLADTFVESGSGWTECLSSLQATDGIRTGLFGAQSVMSFAALVTRK